MRIVPIPKEYSELRPLSPQISGRESAAPHFHPDRKIALPTMEGISFERINHILILEAKGNYTCLHFIGGRRVLVCKTLREMELALHQHAQFVRVHRSFNINLNHVQKYVKGKGGYVIMENGESINVSAGKKQNFLTALDYYFA